MTKKFGNFQKKKNNLRKDLVDFGKIQATLEKFSMFCATFHNIRGNSINGGKFGNFHEKN